MYALDAVATLAGVALVASGLLAETTGPLLLGFLAATYLVWGAGVRVNLQANWSLLEETGTSTNAFSKAAYDLAVARTPRVRIRRICAAVGYVGTELAKELPYYLGAFGAALTDTISSAEALVFLGGANLGAAVYEYGLARLTRSFLSRRSRRRRGDHADPAGTPRAAIPATRSGADSVAQTTESAPNLITRGSPADQPDS
jgi:hypothetical protein